METHEIPQNVTSFEFHLIGDMTIKQFGYLAIGVSIAYLIFVFFAINYPLISWPLIILSAGLGFAFAFVPIGSRPLDYWLSAFLKAIYSPTKRVWKRENNTFDKDPLFKSRLLMYLPSFNSKNAPLPPPGAKPIVYSQQATPIPQPNQSVIQTSNQTMPTKEELSKTVELARQAQSLQVKIIQTERQLTQLRTQTPQPEVQSTDYTRQVNTILEELQKLLGQATQIKQQLETLQQPVKQPETLASSEIKPQVKIKVTLPAKPKQTQVALTSFPNVINGIIKDASANYLDGVIVVIHDKEGMPVRAVKTNKLGQFSGSTPLPNGTYTMEIEKEGYSFDVLQIELEGGIIPPLMITAKA